MWLNWFVGPIEGAVLGADFCVSGVPNMFQNNSFSSDEADATVHLLGLYNLQ